MYEEILSLAYKIQSIKEHLHLIVFKYFHDIICFFYDLTTNKMNAFFSLILIVILLFLSRMLDDLFRRVLGARNFEMKDRYFIINLIIFVTVLTFF